MKSALTAASLLLLVPHVALAHAHLLTPTPRNTAANKTGPCGVVRTASATNFAPGQTITVTWAETIDHPGHYRIAFSPSADQGFDANVLKDNIPNPAGAQANNSTTVTLPSTPCTNCTLQMIQVMTNTTPASNYYSCADITITGGANTAPTIATAAASAPATVNGTTAALSVLGADNAGESALTYSWVATVAPGAVTFSANASNAAKSTTATFARAGAYTFVVTVSDAAGLTATSTLNVTVNATVTSMVLSPVSASVAVAGTRQFTATAYDQFAIALATQPAKTWSVSGGGTVNASGLFTAGGTVAGPFNLTATSGAVSGTASVSVTAGSTPTVATPAAATNTTVTATSTALSVLGADDNAESALVYTWAAPGAPFPVTFSANGTNAAKSTTANFSGAGSYTLMVTIRDAGNLSVTSQVAVTVNQAATMVAVSPSTATVQPAASQLFTAQVSDQFARALSPQPAMGWAVSAGGTMAINGTFTAGTSAGGPFTVTAAAAGKTGTAAVTVSPGNPPSVVTPATAQVATVNATAVGLSVLGADDSGEQAITYTWATMSGPAAVGFSVNGTNAAKSTTATFSRAGVYAFEVTLKDGLNLSTTSTVSVTVNQTVTAVTIAPPATSVVVSGTQAFVATAADQFGMPLASQPAFIWQAMGGGTVSGAGLFTAGTAPGGPYTLTAGSAGKSGSATVTVTAADAPTVAQPANAAPTLITGKTTVLSVLGNDDTGEAGLTYRWSAPLAPAPVSFSVNGTNAAKSVTATFAQPGLYRFEVAITDASNKTALSSIEVEVQQSVSRIAVTPATATLAAKETLQFAAATVDQFDVPLSAAPMVLWSATGGGSLSTSGLFTAGGSAGGPFTITAQASGLSGSAQVTVTGAVVDSAFPEVRIDSPGSGQTVGGILSLRATATDDVGVVQVSYLLQGEQVGSVSAAPWALDWNSSAHADGDFGLVAEARDAAGNVTRSKVVRILLRNRNGKDVTAGCAASPAPPLAAMLALVAMRLVRRRGARAR